MLTERGCPSFYFYFPEAKPSRKARQKNLIIPNVELVGSKQGVFEVHHPKHGNYFTATLKAKKLRSSPELDHAIFFWLMPHKVAVWIYWHLTKEAKDYAKEDIVENFLVDDSSSDENSDYNVLAGEKIGFANDLLQRKDGNGYFLKAFFAEHSSICKK
ncbi:uncharacterized protein [Phaseolus vulgaris]|uniref:uncharacterized protein isoform X2 n=1 Tax=Phaseolus vulgaris TaxID=3885 RepID=UPI0035CB8AF7